MRTKCAKFFLVSLILFFAFPAFAENTANSEPLTFNAKELAYSSSSSDGGGSFLGEFFADIFAIIWGANNLFVTFDDYPYKDGPYLKTQSVISALSNTDSSTSGKSSRYALDGSFFCYPGEAIGVGLRFEGFLWKCIGPVLEFNIYNPHSVSSSDSFYSWRYKTDESIANIRLGGELSLIQTNPFSAMVYLQWTHFFDPDLPAANGVVLGAIVRSYPVAPFLIEWRGNIQAFSAEDDSLGIVESHLEVGCMVSGPWELYVAWNYTMNDILRIEGHGFEAGARLHF